MFRIRTPLLTLAAALACALPAAAQSRAEQLLSDRPLTRRGCEVSRDPRQLPTVAQLADSAALEAAVTAYARSYPISGGQPMFALYSITFGPHGVLDRVRAIDYFLPSGHEAELAALVRTAIQPQRGAFTMRLRVEPGAARVLRVGRSEYCPPTSNLRFSLGLPINSQEVPQMITVRTTVRDNGQVRAIEILRGTGNDELDHWVRETLGRREFQPGLIDGEAVEMEYEESIRIGTR